MVVGETLLLVEEGKEIGIEDKDVTELIDGDVEEVEDSFELVDDSDVKLTKVRLDEREMGADEPDLIELRDVTLREVEVPEVGRKPLEELKPLDADGTTDVAGSVVDALELL